jgi:hypothetical protein
MEPKVLTVEQKLDRIASGAQGVVTREEMFAAGITREEIKRRVRKGALIRAHRGVYRVGHHAPASKPSTWRQ